MDIIQNVQFRKNYLIIIFVFVILLSKSVGNIK